MAAGMVNGFWGADATKYRQLPKYCIGNCTKDRQVASAGSGMGGQGARIDGKGDVRRGKMGGHGSNT